MKIITRVMMVAVLMMFAYISSAIASPATTFEATKNQKIVTHKDCSFGSGGDLWVEIDAEFKSPPGVIDQAHIINFLGCSEHVPGGDPKYTSITGCVDPVDAHSRSSSILSHVAIVPDPIEALAGLPTVPVTNLHLFVLIPVFRFRSDPASK